jgi:small subunit ribosomal protein S16
VTVRIRMKRLGRKHRPFYRICVMDQKKARDGKAIEEIGTYDPMVKDKSKRVVIALDRVDYWKSVGAQPSEKVAVLIEKVRKGNWGTAKAPPPLTPPKEPAAPAAEGENAEAPAEAAAE